MNRLTFRRVFGYTAAMPAALPRSTPNQDRRDQARYTIPEAAAYIAVPERTMRSWFRGDRRLFNPTYARGSSIFLSFFDVTEAYVIETLRTHWEFKPRKLRKIVHYLRKTTGNNRPLLRQLGIIKEFQNLVLPSRQKGKIVHTDIAGDENLVFEEFVKTLAVRIKRDSKGKPALLYPGDSTIEDSLPVSMDPDVMSGELVVTGTRIPAVRIMENYYAGKSAEKIADSYGLDRDRIRKVINHFERE